MTHPAHSHTTAPAPVFPIRRYETDDLDDLRFGHSSSDSLYE